MTIIVGPNNSNKTYIAYSIYGLWQSMNATTMRTSRSKSLFTKDEQGVFSAPIETLYKAFTTQTTLTVENFEAELGNFYQDSSQSLFSKTHYEVEFSINEFREVLNSLSGTSLIPLIQSYSLSMEDSRIILSPSRSTPSFEEDDFISAEYIGRSVLLLIRRVTAQGFPSRATI